MLPKRAPLCSSVCLYVRLSLRPLLVRDITLKLQEILTKHFVVRSHWVKVQCTGPVTLHCLILELLPLVKFYTLNFVRDITMKLQKISIRNFVRDLKRALHKNRNSVCLNLGLLSFIHCYTLKFVRNITLNTVSL